MATATADASKTEDAEAAEAERPRRPMWEAYHFGSACSKGGHMMLVVRDMTSPEHMASHSDVDLNARVYRGATGFYWACLSGSIDVVQYLTSPAMLAAGIDVNNGTSTGTSPLAVAAWYGHVDVVRHLLESPDLAAAGVTVDVNAANAGGWTALHRACMDCAPPELVSLLLRQPHLDVFARDTAGQTALQAAEANTQSGGHGAEKAALLREVMGPRVLRLMLAVVVLARREGRVAPPQASAAATAGARTGADADAAPAVPAGTLDEGDEEARARRRLVGSLPSHLLRTVCAFAAGV